jgi:hypothetical protein
MGPVGTRYLALHGALALDRSLDAGRGLSTPATNRLPSAH